MKILFIANSGFTLSNFRRDLILELVSKRHDIHCCIPDKDALNHDLKSLSVHIHTFRMSRRGLNPFVDLLTCSDLFRHIKALRPDIVLNYTIKPTLYGSFTAHFLRTKMVASNITGLGYLFIQNSLKAKILRFIVKKLYRLSLSRNNIVFFQNPDDARFFSDEKLVLKDKIRQINGSGVNLDKFSHDKKRNPEYDFLLIARLLKDKGVGEYISAARDLKLKYPHLTFALLGPIDENPASFSQADVDEWEKQKVVTYLGEVSDVIPYLQETKVFVLPSYREGTPRSTLEAMAMGLPVVTTDVPGCRETVKNNVNGFLVPVRNAEALKGAMLKFIEEPLLVETMGSASRKYVEEKFDVKKVNKVIMNEIGL